MKTISIILAFYMFLGSLIPRTDFSQLMHLPDVMEHFELHQAEAEKQGIDFCFIEFLQLHVLSSQQHQHDDPGHQETPPCQSFHISVLLSFVDVSHFFQDISFPTFNQKVDFQQGFYTSNFIKLLLRPPVFS